MTKSDNAFRRLLDTPLVPGKIGHPSRAPVGRVHSRKIPWLDRRVGFVGSRAIYDVLRFECTTIALDPGLAQALLPARLLDAIILECAPDEVASGWRDGFHDYAGHHPAAQGMIELARQMSVPVIALLDGQSARIPLFEPLAKAADHVVVTSLGAQQALSERGIGATLLPAPVQTGLYHGFADAADTGAVRPLLSFDLERAADDADVRTFLASLIPFGLRLCSRHDQVAPSVRARLGDLAGSVDGFTTAGQRETLFAQHDILVQISDPARDESTDRKLALDAAAARCSVVVLGQPSADDPRRNFAIFCESGPELRAMVSRLQMRPLEAEEQLQRSWRAVHRDHTGRHLVAGIARLCGFDVAASAPRASVIVPTRRPDRLPHVLQAYRHQSWADKELIVVALTDDPEGWEHHLLAGEASERMVFLPSDLALGRAMAIGAGRARGDYVVLMTDDDSYGTAYVEDLMLAASALGADILTKPRAFYSFDDETRVMRDTCQPTRPTVLDCNLIDWRELLQPGGVSWTARRAILDETVFSEPGFGMWNTGVPGSPGGRSGSLCASADSLNMVIQRSSDESREISDLMSARERMVDVRGGIDTFLAP